jgi:anti-sigma regulatory factor (Ser/Thr protein kinase)
MRRKRKRARIRADREGTVSTLEVAPLLDARVSIDGFHVLLAGGPEAAAKARGAVTRLRSDLDDPLVENLRLLVTELVTNSVRHADARQIELVVVVRDDRVRVEVENRGPSFHPAPRNGNAETEGGWGLLLVERLSDSWGVGEDAGRTCVWFELARA